MRMGFFRYMRLSQSILYYVFSSFAANVITLPLRGFKQVSLAFAIGKFYKIMDKPLRQINNPVLAPFSVFYMQGFAFNIKIPNLSLYCLANPQPRAVHKLKEQFMLRVFKRSEEH